MDDIWRTPFETEPTSVYEYMTFDSSFSTQTADPNTLFSSNTYLKLSNKRISQSRTVYTLYALVSDVGGLQGVLIPFFAYLMSWVQP